MIWIQIKFITGMMVGVEYESRIGDDENHYWFLGIHIFILSINIGN
jgi:hypothetical protein